MAIFAKLWDWLKSPFEKKPAQHEVRDVETMAIVVHQRPEEMQIVRWAAQARSTLKADIDDTAKTIEASTPLLAMGVGFIAFMWMSLLIGKVFAMAMKGAPLASILWTVADVTFTMGVVGLVLMLVYLLVTTVGVMLIRRTWRLFNWAMGREVQPWMFSAAEVFQKSATGRTY